MKKNQLFIISILMLCFILTAGGCGSGGDSSGMNIRDSHSENAAGAEMEGISDPAGIIPDSDSASGSDGSSGIDSSSGTKSSASTNDSPGADESAGQPSKEQTDNGTDAPSVRQDMLVYTCHLSIDTLDYDTSIQTFKQMLSTAGGFIEQEKYSDGQSSDPYYIEETEKQKLYTATVRVPHDRYDAFLNGADQLGDIRSKSSNVENLGQEYTDLNTSLQIYEAKEKRYIKMLSTITDDEQAIRVEKELTELQVKIAGIKTRMTEIRTDVDYSTIELQLREVTKYDEAPQQTDTFFQRLGNTITDTWKNFLVFLEAMLFFFIRIMPYAVIIGLIALVILWITKKRKEKKEKEVDQFPKQQ